jgi:hypothetical protein
VVHEHRFNELAAGFLERRGGDYQTLLGYGRVTLEPVPDPDGWRREIRRQARRDRVRVRTWVDEHGAVGAMINPDVSNPAVYQAELDRFGVVQAAAMKLLMAGHFLGAWLRRGDESITFCTRCDARVYIRTAPPVIRDGEAFETACLPL